MGQERYARDQFAKLREDLQTNAFSDDNKRTEAIFKTWLAVEATNPSGEPRGPNVKASPDKSSS